MPFFLFQKKFNFYYIRVETKIYFKMNILVDGVTKTYGEQKAVDNISFEVKTGEVLGFLGPNGAGKSTTMKAITCYLTPDNGNIKVGEWSVNENPDAIKRHIGYLPESNPLYQDMSLIDYLLFVAELEGIKKEKIKDRVREMISRCGLQAERHKKIKELSKGYQQRVGLAQALIHDPDVLVLDEPTTGLDPNQRIEIRELIKEIGKEKTVILSSHILAEVEATCDRILIINKGKIVANGSPEELKKRAQGNEILKVRVEGGEKENIFESLKNLDSIQVVDVIEKNYFYIQSKEGMFSAQKIFKMCVDKDWYISEMVPVKTNLEDIFRELTMN